MSRGSDSRSFARFVAALLRMMSSGWQTWKALDLDVPLPRVVEGFNAVGGEDEVQVERAVLGLHEILAALDISSLLIGEGKSELQECVDQSGAVLRGFLDEDVSVLGRVREAKKDRAGLAQEQVPYRVPGEGVAYLLSLGVFKPSGHSLTNSGGFLHTRRGTRPSSRMTGTRRRRGQACVS